MIDLRLGNVLDVLRTMDAESVHCIVTSPPYWGLRAYGTEPQVWRNGSEPCDVHQWGETQKINKTGGTAHALGYTKNQFVSGETSTCSRCGAWRGELGLEPTPELYVDHIVQIMREARRVLRDDGTCWINLGDSYAGSWGASGHRPEWDGGEGIQREKNTAYLDRKGYKEHRDTPPTAKRLPGLKPKDLVGIPWRVAFALQADGWYLRSDIIWHKPNPMPESVRDRPTKAHEYLFLLAKQTRYYYDADAVREPHTEPWRGKGEKEKNNWSVDCKRGSHETVRVYNPAGRNRRSVWTVTTQPYSGAHFATFPPKLIEPCILAGCPVGGTVLDPFNGAGTTGLVAVKHRRNYIGIDLKPEYLEMTRKRLDGVQMVTG